MEEVHAQLLEPSTGDGGEEVDAFVQRVDLDGGLRGRGEGALGALAGGAEAAERAGVGGYVFLVLALELLDKVVHETVVEVLASQVGVAGGCLHLKDAVLNGEEGDVEGATSQVEDEHVLLGAGALVETVRDGCCGGLVDDTEAVEA